ncbi:MAG: hypothetical protein AAGB19_04680 [Cyanobacteria bacterium P01_F01_bin.3]
MKQYLTNPQKFVDSLTPEQLVFLGNALANDEGDRFAIAEACLVVFRTYDDYGKRLIMSRMRDQLCDRVD